MSSKLERQDIAKMFLCSSILEEHISKAYQSLADRVTNSQISKLLNVISVDSRKHSVLLKLLSESIQKITVSDMSVKKYSVPLGRLLTI